MHMAPMRVFGLGLGLELEPSRAYGFKDTGAYEIIEILYLGFRVVFDGKKS